MKVKVYFWIGVILLQIGVCWIHQGLGLVVLGLWCFLISYAEFEEKEAEDGERFVYKDNQCTITIDFCYMRGDDGMNFINRLVDIDGATFNFNAYVNDVHILQNVLRQLDIDKEIVVKR